jgi:starch phosphorylase
VTRVLHRYTVHAALPERLSCLMTLAYNLRWTWDHETIELFKRLDPELWARSNHNPAWLLSRVDQEKFDDATRDESFLAQLDRVCTAFREYMNDPGRFARAYPEMAGTTIAYFCMEFGLAECLPIYSGGLGVLAGDHLKAASGFGLPLVGVGLLYQKGYFRQYLTSDGWQLERYPLNDFSTLPIQPARAADGSPLSVSVRLGERDVVVKVWVAEVGRIPLYLLDTNVPENQQEDQDVTDELYGGGPETRIRQEIVLGIGGIRALRAMGIEPTVCHLNEGHSAFLSLERIRHLIKAQGLDYRGARQVTGAGTLFTTHTPVPAGFDLFTQDLIEKYFADYVKELGLTVDSFMAKGRVNPKDDAESFNVAALAVRHSFRRNAVSRLHQRVTAEMMRAPWADFPLTEVPIGYITNGVYLRGWVGGEMARLFDRYVGPAWREDPADPGVWERVDTVPDEELWRAHVRQREHLITYARGRLAHQLERRHASRREYEAAREALSADALTIGFARRFATYKRANLLLRQAERVKTILLDPERPVQLIFSGKAHPRDDAGKEFIREIVHFAAAEGVQHRLVFLEDHGIDVTRELVRGCDVWLNTPRRPMEASGTSGMKVVSNGGLNLSVLDGWWDEGYSPEVGWAIGTGEEYADHDYQDRVESQAVYSLLEQEVIPLFYDRGADGLPRGWIRMMKASMRILGPRFSASRMLREYTEQYYVPAALHHGQMAAANFELSRQLAAWKEQVQQAWPEVAVVAVEDGGVEEVTVGSELTVVARVRLGRLTPDDVRVEAYHGRLAPDGSLIEGAAAALSWSGTEGDVHVYRGAVPCVESGLNGYAIRVLPSREGVLVPNELALVAWE